jgi:cell division protein ZapA
MAQVTIRINGYAYTVGCEDGQETHLEQMAANIEQRIASIKAIGGQSGEARLLMLAALLLADELHDTRNALESTTVSNTQSTAPTTPKPDPEKAAKLRRLAARAEEIAADLADA